MAVCICPVCGIATIGLPSDSAEWERLNPSGVNVSACFDCLNPEREQTPIDRRLIEPASDAKPRPPREGYF